MPHYKLVYFDLRGRGEVARQLFALAGVDYEDHRIQFEQWPALKPTTPYGQLPVLEVDGVVLAQSVAIARLLSKRFGFYGSNDWEAAQIDALADQFNDYFGEQNNFFPVLIGRDEGDKDKLQKEAFEPARDKFFPILVKYLKETGSGFLVGSKPSYFDLALAEHVSTFEAFAPGCFDKYPEVLAHRDRVRATPALKAWIEKRPKTLF